MEVSNDATIGDRVTDAIKLAATAIASMACGDLASARGVLIEAAEMIAPTSQTSLPGIQGPSTAKPAESLAIAARRLFAYWQERCNHKQAKLTPERVQKIIGRLRDGYSEAQIRKAIDGAADSAFTNSEGKTFDDIELICRNGVKLESFIDRGTKATGEIIEDTTNASPIDEQISALRARMSALAKEGRDTEYKSAATELRALVDKRNKETPK